MIRRKLIKLKPVPKYMPRPSPGSPQKTTQRAPRPSVPRYKPMPSPGSQRKPIVPGRRRPARRKTIQAKRRRGIRV